MGEQKYPEPTVGCFILNREGKVLVVNSPKWNRPTIPGGHIEVGETAEQAAVREAREEVGIDVRPMRLLKVQEAIFPNGFKWKKHFIFFDYLCEAGDEKVKVDGDEITSYEWMEPREAMNVLDEFSRRTLGEYLDGVSG